jgi:hypothetical protein
MQTDDLMFRQSILVQQMADLITQAAPNRRVHLRFINKNKNKDNKLKPSELAEQLDFIPDGSTMLGTNFKTKVLQEFLYDPINRGFELRRPLLILIITDGRPAEEFENNLQNVIKESMVYLAKEGYGPQGKLLNMSLHSQYPLTQYSCPI